MSLLLSILAEDILPIFVVTTVLSPFTVATLIALLKSGL
jgi:hypothetical protein